MQKQKNYAKEQILFRSSVEYEVWFKKVSAELKCHLFTIAPQVSVIARDLIEYLVIFLHASWLHPELKTPKHLGHS